MAVCKKYSLAIQDLLKCWQDNKISKEEFGETLIKYSDGEANICLNCKKHDKCHKSD